LSVKKIRQALKDFGLSQKEAEIYISLGKHGALTGGEISKLTKTTSVRNIQNKDMTRVYMPIAYMTQEPVLSGDCIFSPIDYRVSLTFITYGPINKL